MTSRRLWSWPVSIWGMFRDKVDVNVQTSEKLDDIMSQLGGEGLEE